MVDGAVTRNGGVGWRTPDDPLAVIQGLLFSVDRSYAALARAAGLATSVVGRLATASRHARLFAFLAALERLDLGLLVCTRHESGWRVLALPRGRLGLPPGARVGEG